MAELISNVLNLHGKKTVFYDDKLINNPFTLYLYIYICIYDASRNSMVIRIYLPEYHIIDHE